MLSASVNPYQVFSGSPTCALSRVEARGSAPLFHGATWNNQPTVGSVRGSANIAGDLTNCSNQTGFKPITITGLVAEWLQPGAPARNTVALTASETDPSHSKGFYSMETIGSPYLSVNYLTTPNQARDLEPADGETVDTLAPTLSALVDGGDGGLLNVFFKLRNAAGVEIATHNPLVAPGERATWVPPANLLRPGLGYTWEVTNCVGYFPVYCAPPATASFTVNAALGAGEREFFTYTGRGLTDRSGLKVNVASGNLMVTATDLSIAGTGTPLVASRAYNSTTGENGVLGPRWAGSSTTTLRLEENPDDSFTYWGETGQVSLISRNDDDSGWTTAGDLDAEFIDGGAYGVFLLRFHHDRGAHAAGDLIYFYNSGPLKGKPRSVLDRNGHSVVFEYSGDRISRAIDTQSRPVDYAYDAAGRLVELSDPNGDRRVTYGYSGDVLTSVTDANGHATTYGYDGANLSRVTDPRGSVTDIVYDTRSRVTSLTQEVSGVDETTTFAYTEGQPGQPNTTVVTDANGHATTYRYDNANRVTRAVDPLGELVDTGYDINSNVTSIKAAANTPTTLGYSPNGNNNLMSSEMPTGATTSYAYNNTNPSNPIASYQATGTTDAQGNSVTGTYDDRGNGTGSTNELAAQNTSTVARQGSGASCGAQRGQVCSSTNARGHTTSFGYDAVGNLTSVNPPAPLGDTTVTYDAVSRVASVTDGKGQRTTFAYDHLDRVTSTTYAHGAVISYSYDPNANPTARADRVGSWTYRYDEANRLMSSSGPGEDVTYAYDPVGNLVELTEAGGTTRYRYTDVNLVEEVTDPDGGVTSIGYDPDNNTWRTNVNYPNGVYMVIDHDGSGRTTDIVGRGPTGRVLSSHRYNYSDPATTNDTALRQSRTTPSEVTDYSYDALNRLTDATSTNHSGVPGARYTYGYDGAGNRTSANLNGQQRTYTYNAADQITSGGARHDANGNLTASTDYAFQALGYNATDQTTTITPRGGTAAAQTYAGASQDQRRTSGDRSFVTSASVGVTTITTAGEAVHFTRDNTGTLINMRRPEGTYHYLFDGQGSVVGVTDQAGNLVNDYKYTPYGDRTIALETVPNPWQYVGGYTDTNGTTYKYGTRYYDATTGRWTQLDPSGQDDHAYAYSANNPVNYTDPTGLDTCGEDWNIGGFVDCASKVDDAASSFLDKCGEGFSKAGYAVGAGIVVFGGPIEVGMAVGYISHGAAGLAGGGVLLVLFGTACAVGYLS